MRVEGLAGVTQTKLVFVVGIFGWYLRLSLAPTLVLIPTPTPTLTATPSSSPS